MSYNGMASIKFVIIADVITFFLQTPPHSWHCLLLHTLKTTHTLKIVHSALIFHTYSIVPYRNWSANESQTFSF